MGLSSVFILTGDPGTTSKQEQRLRVGPMNRVIRYLFLGTFVLFLTVSTLQGQTYRLENVKVRLLNGQTLKGRLVGLTRDSLSLQSATDVRSLSYQTIDWVAAQKVGSIGFGIVVGAVVGAVFGLVILGDDNGSTSGYVPPQHSANAIGYGLIGALVGAPVGGVIGMRKKRISIEGELQKFRAFRGKCQASIQALRRE